jgi:anti-sigma factor RsiW
MKRAIAVAGKRYEPSAEFREKVRQSLGKSRRREGAWVWRIVALPATLVLVLSLLVAFYVDREKARRQRLYSELTDLHVSTLASASPVDVISTDRHTVKPWFQGKIPFSFNLPELQGTDFTLVGGRVTYLAQSPGAANRFASTKSHVYFPGPRGGTATLASSPVSMPRSLWKAGRRAGCAISCR